MTAYRGMLLARILDEKMASLYRGGKIHGGVFLGRGQEALSVSVGLSLAEGGFFAPLIRDAAGRLAFGETGAGRGADVPGLGAGPDAGRDGNVHRGKPDGGLSADDQPFGGDDFGGERGAAGAAAEEAITGTVGAACIGDGGDFDGGFSRGAEPGGGGEAAAGAGGRATTSTPIRRRTSANSPARTCWTKRWATGWRGTRWTGRDLAGLSAGGGRRGGRGARGAGPQLVVARLLRLCGHGEHDDASYVDARLKAAPTRPGLPEGGGGAVAASRNGRTSRRWTAGARKPRNRWRTRWRVAQREPAPDPYQENWRRSPRAICWRVQERRT